MKLNKGAIVLAAFVINFVTCDDEYHPIPRTKSARSSNGRNVDDDQDLDYWIEEGTNNLLSSLDTVTKAVNEHAKNIIIFVGDGMSIPTLTGARINKAQINGNWDTPETEQLFFETLDHVGLSKTYSVNTQVVDSAASGTAMFSGVKTKSGTLGFDSHIEYEYPESMDKSIETTSIMTYAQEAGMATGIVTTARLTHATPAAMYAHTFSRAWECDDAYAYLIADDSEATEQPEGYYDIAYQLINNSPGKDAKVLMGGGYPPFFPLSMADDLEQELGEYSSSFPCFRADETDLTAQWLEEKGEGARFVMTGDELDGVNVEEIDYLFGLFGSSHMEYNHNRQEGRDPSLAQMVEKALGILKKETNGFLLMVEGGRIDHGHHEVKARTAFDETIAMDLAVETAVNTLKDEGMFEETLVIVTADHGHTMSISGYPTRGNDILGLSTEYGDDLASYSDGLPYTTLTYANGPAFYDNNIPNPDNPNRIMREDLTNVDVTGWEYEYTSAGPLYLETHSGDDVAIFASGPGSFLFHTSHEQTHVFQVMAYSACIGDYLGYSETDEICRMRVGGQSDSTTENSASTSTLFSFLLLLPILLALTI